MAQSQTVSKVLRIGIVQDGKIVQERLIKAGEPVTVGESTNNTFVFPPTGLPRRYPLFVPKGRGYHLNLTDAMGGKVSFKNAIVSLDQLRQRGEAVRKGTGFVLPLSESNRGKITLDGITVLFQFVPTPPEPLRAIKQDFRPRLIDEDDPVFLGFLALWASVATVMMIMVWNADPAENRGLSKVPDRFVKLALQAPEDNEPPPELDEPKPEEMDNGEKIAKKKAESGEAAAQQPAENTEAPKEMTAQEAKVQEAKQAEQNRQEVLEKSSLLMALIGTTGEANNGSAIHDLLSDDDWGGQNLDSALQGVSGAEVATADSQVGVRGSATGEVGTADIGDLAQAAVGGTGAVGEGPATQVEGKVIAGHADIMGGEDVAGIEGIIRKYRGQMKYCYDTRLKENPNLEGRVEVQWSISRGRVMSAMVLGNTTGDAQLESCVLRKVQTWRFDSAEDADITYPFIFAR